MVCVTSSETSVDPLQVRQWHRDGYLHLTDLIPPDTCSRLGSWVDDIATSSEASVLQHYEMTDDGPVLARSEHFATAHEGWASLVADDALLMCGKELVGEPIVLYKKKINYKQPGGAGFAPHQDATAYRFVDTHVTCMIAIDDCTIENGCLEVVSGAQSELIVDDGEGCLSPSAERAFTWEPIKMRTGDVLWFHSRTPHRSGPNLSDAFRRAVFLTFNAASEGDLRGADYADKLAHLGGHHPTGTARVSTIGHFRGRASEEGSDRSIAEQSNDTTSWMSLKTPADVADAIADLYRRRGTRNYDETVTQNAHALQCATLALDSGASIEAVVAAYLHDIGHLLVGEHDDQDDFLDRDLHHEDVGARFLSNWFSPAVTEPIRLHVTAKRYLCAIDPEYHDGLSDASVRSLVVQGGPMTGEEVDEFRERDGSEVAVDLRLWDDRAKHVEADTVSESTLRDLIESVVRFTGPST